MAWKNIKQSSLADALLIEHRALTELDDILTLINWQSIESILPIYTLVAKESVPIHL